MLFIIDSKEKRKAAAEYVARLTSSPCVSAWNIDPSGGVPGVQF
jgi:hypothetical protein